MKGKSMRSLLPVFLLALNIGACNRTSPPARVENASAPQAASAVKSGRVAKVVFVDKENACQCTRKRVDDTWAALQSALGTPSKVPVERWHVDTQAAQVATYTKAKPLMVPPGVYFVDSQQQVTELLQGEVTAEEIAKVLTAP